ncbi:MAG TPA: hypothetical protein VF507_06035, partial [Pyrinomonadaceae bacterium]
PPCVRPFLAPALREDLFDDEPSAFFAATASLVDFLAVPAFLAFFDFEDFVAISFSLRSEA